MTQLDLSSSAKTSHSTGDASVSYTGTFKRHPSGGAPAFLHPCGICGAAVAPFGYGVKMRAAIDSGNPAMAGRWLCKTCRDCVGDLS